MEDAREYLLRIPSFAREKHSLSQAEAFLRELDCPLPGVVIHVADEREGFRLRLPLIHSPGIRITCGNIYLSPSDGYPGTDLPGRGDDRGRGVSEVLYAGAGGR